MTIQTIGVVGAGSMGSGIANLAALNGFNVILRDIEDRFLDNGMKRIAGFMQKSVERGKMTEDEKEATLGRIRTTTNMEDFKDADLVIEAVIENMDLKKKSSSNSMKLRGMRSFWQRIPPPCPSRRLLR